MSDNRAIVYAENDKIIYRASSVGLPLRCLTAARTGYDALPPPEYLANAAEAGNRAEVIVKAQLRVEGYKISGEQGVIELEVLPGIIVRGHMDATHCVLPDTTEDRILEVKSMSERVFNEWLTYGFERFHTYAAQVSVYMAARQSQAVYAAVNRDSYGGELELDVRILRDYPVSIPSIIDHIAQVEEAAKDNILPQCTGAKYQCPYNYLCDANEMMLEEVEDGTEAMLIDLGDQYSHLLDLEEEVKSQKNALRDEIRVALAGREEVAVPGFSFTQRPRTSKRLNAARLRKVLGDEVEKFYDETISDPVLRVTRKRSTST